jgi:ornithine cyclodeaminase
LVKRFNPKIMKTLILNHEEVSELLPIKECIAVMREALLALAEGKAYQPLRTITRPPDAKGVMGLMPSYMSGDRAAFGLKAICVFPGNPAKGLDSHQGAVLLFSAETGELLALMNASAITAIRTAAVSGVATELLGQPGPCSLALIGSGVQARSHLPAMAAVRSIKSCRVTSRHYANAQKFCEEMQGDVSFPLEAVETVEGALKGAELIVTTTTAREPILKREWISPGAHLNLVGSSTPKTREIDSETMAAVSLFVDRRESTLNESGDYLLAAREGVIGPDHIRAELGEVLKGERPGRTASDEITCFKSLGIGIEDLFSAEYLYRRAMERNVGSWVEF